MVKFKTAPSDPVEHIIFDALLKAGIEFIQDSDECDPQKPITKGLDFYLIDYGIHIECKRYHTERVNEQIKRSANVIVIQGMESAKFFADIFLLKYKNEIGCF